jgi:lysozyme
MNADRLRARLIKDEGLRLKPYRCTAGKLTIGVGRNLDDRGITREEAMILLDNSIAECVTELTRAFDWFPKLDPVRQEVLINMAFNLGMDRLGQFKFTLGAISRGDYTQAANRMLQSKWAEQVGRRATELAEMMRTGTHIE